MAKKFSFKKLLLQVTALASVAALSIAGTVAYLQDTDSDVNVMTLGNVSIEQHEYQRDEGVAHNAGEAGKGNGVKEGALVPYEQGQALYPAFPKNNAATDYTAEATDLFFWGDYVFSGTAGNGLWNDSKLSNVMDKFVFVENTGKSDAYFRTVIAFECPEGITIGEPANGAEIMINTNGGNLYTWENVGFITVDNVRYAVYEATYLNALAAGNQAHPSLLQVVMTHHATNEDMALLGDTYEILVVSQAVQAKGFADAETALDAAFGDITEQNHPWAAATQEKVGDDAALENALKNPDASTIIVELTDDVTYDVAAWAANGMGGEKTDLIVINGNGNTITFNQTDSDWNNIVTNGAKLVINNAKITNSGYNNGPWNRHDLNFACEVELNNVVSDKAIALKAGAALNNVTIDDANTSDTYALWIQPNGQTVTLDDCVIDMIDCTDGRGIKIDEQYVDAPEKVTLKVSDTVFKTEEKSAILVKSVAGADITVDNIDIYGVKADPVNAVWVDEASAAYADLVTVTGGKKAVEGETKVVAAATATEVKSAIKSGADVINANGANIGPLVLASSDVPVGKTVTIANAVVSGKSYDNGVNGTVVFDNCTFTNTGAYSIHFAYGNGNVVFNNCKLDGWCSFGKAVKSVEMNGCTFTGNGTYAMIRFYQDVTLTDCTFDCSNTNTTDGYQDGIDMVEGYTATMINCTNVNGSVADLFEAADIAGTDGKVIIK